ncbi:hypothetical protein Leryth_013977 [Lithospermum erythrorhizon]|nr:hypothetical protein Leryth_013977 [Lithospermum erythrorhizon]
MFYDHLTKEPYVKKCMLSLRNTSRAFGVNVGEQSRNCKCKALKRDDLNKLPCIEYKGGDEEEEEGPMDCAICLEVFVKDDQCRLLPSCNHKFHVNCIDSWLLKQPFCPICRACANFVKHKS